MTTKCPNCGKDFTRKRVDQGYCSVACSKEGDTRELRRARVLYRALYWWRFDRKTAADNLRFICREIRHWIEEDMEAGRGAPPRMNFEADRGHMRRKRPTLPAPKVTK